MGQKIKATQAAERGPYTMTTTPQAALLPINYFDVQQAAETYGLDYNKLGCAVRDILAKLQATQELVQAGSASLLDGCKSIMDSIAVSSSVIEHNKQEPVQAGELPALPHDGWPARFRCDSCDGNGEIGELISMGHFQPPERQTCPDCGGRGWSDEGPAFNADHMRDYARAVLSARKPLTSEQVKALKGDYGYSLAPVQAQADFINGIRCGEKAHGIDAAMRKDNT